MVIHPDLASWDMESKPCGSNSGTMWESFAADGRRRKGTVVCVLDVTYSPFGSRMFICLEKDDLILLMCGTKCEELPESRIRGRDVSRRSHSLDDGVYVGIGGRGRSV